MTCAAPQFLSLSPDNWNPSRHSAITAEVFGSISDDFSHLRSHLTPASTSHVPGSIGMHWLKQFLSWGKIYVALGGLELVCRPNCTGTQIYLPLPAHSWFLYETVLMYNPGWSQLLRLQGCPVFLVVGLTTRNGYITDWFLSLKYMFKWCTREHTFYPHTWEVGKRGSAVQACLKKGCE